MQAESDRATRSRFSDDTGAMTCVDLRQAGRPTSMKEHKIETLAIAGNKQWSKLPNVPTASESGLPGFEASEYPILRQASRWDDTQVWDAGGSRRRPVNVGGPPIAFQRRHAPIATKRTERKTLLELLRKLRISVAAASEAGPDKDRRLES
jgi:hypothetical protein